MRPEPSVRSVTRALSVIAFALAGCGRPAVEPASILLVTFDTTRADHIGCYGHRQASTPNLDRLASEGVRFDEARTHVPLTLPSHTTILTGLLPPHHGIRGNGLFRLKPEVATLASALRGRGYATAAVVASVVLDRTYGLDRGFDTYDDNQRVGDKAAFNYLERGAGQIADSATRILPHLKPPFFLWVHLYDPHRPWVAPAAVSAQHPNRPYDAEIAFADSAFGEIRRAALARADGRLVVIAAGDHGESLGEHGESRHGYTLHRGVLRVPLIIAGSGIPGGRVVVETVGLVDVAPTVAELAGASLPASDGRSLRRFWGGSGPAPGAGHGEPLWEETLHPLYESGWAPLRGLVSEEWHFVDAPRPELYARRSDPDDRNDVALTRGDVVQELRAKLSGLGRALGDTPEPQPEIGDEPEDREQLAKLASLGYLGAAPRVPRSGPRLDPKDGLPGFVALEEAEELFKQGRLSDALNRIEPLTRTDPDNPRIWHAWGMTLRAMDRPEEASRALERALALDPRSESIRFAYADLLRARGDLAGSRGELARILVANPKMVEATLVLSGSFDASGDPAASQKALQTSYDAGVRDPDLLLRLGEHLAQAGSPEAAGRFAEVLALRPDDPEALLETGRAAIDQGAAAKAIERLSRCATGPKALECRIELARAYVVGPRDFAHARSALLSARSLAQNPETAGEVERRLRVLDQMEAGAPSAPGR